MVISCAGRSGGGTSRSSRIVPGELLMWSTLVKPYRSTAVSTTRQETEAITIDGEKLRSLCEEDHELGYRMLISLTQLLAARLEGARVQLATVD